MGPEGGITKYLVFLFLSWSSVSVGESCLDVLQFNLHPDINVVADKGLTSSQISEVKQVLFDIDLMIRNFLLLPENVHLVIKKDSEMAESHSKYLEVPYRYSVSRDGKKFVKDPVATRAIIVHEYAHVLYSVNIEKGFPRYAQFRERTKTVSKDNIVRFGNLLVPLQSELNDISRFVISNRVTGQNLTELRQRMEGLEKQIKEINERLATAEPLVAFFDRPLDLPYAELFADVVVVAYTRNPKALVDALQFPGIPPSPGSDRDFSVPVDPKTWNDASEHMLFNPVRYYIWTKYLSKPGLLPGFVISVVLSAIQNELADRDSKSLFDLSPSSLNERLIKRVDEAFTSSQY